MPVAGANSAGTPSPQQEQPADQTAAPIVTTGEAVPKLKKGKAVDTQQTGMDDATTEVPVDQQTPAANCKQKKKGEPPANKDQKGQPVCDPRGCVCPPPAQ